MEVQGRRDRDTDPRFVPVIGPDFLEDTEDVSHSYTNPDPSLTQQNQQEDSSPVPGPEEGAKSLPERASRQDYPTDSSHVHLHTARGRALFKEGGDVNGVHSFTIIMRMRTYHDAIHSLYRLVTDDVEAESRHEIVRGHARLQLYDDDRTTDFSELKCI